MKNLEKITTHVFSKRERWEINWIKLCNGKLLFENIHNENIFKCSPLEFKKRIIRKMKEKRTDNWQNMEYLLKKLLEIPDS